MVAPLPQERLFKREFDMNRLAALRGDSLEIPEYEDDFEEAANNDQYLNQPTPLDGANNDRFFARDSEDSLLAKYPQAEPETPEYANNPGLDPANFSMLQQQARMDAGIGAPEILSPEASEMLDPEYSTDEAPVTYGESVGALQGLAQRAMELEEVQNIAGEIRSKSKEAVDKAAEELQQKVREQTRRWIAKALGNGGNASDIFSWDFWIVFAITYISLMARGVVSVLSPESSLPQDFSTFKQGMQYTTTKAIHAILPPYRPFREPGDFAYFLLFFVGSLLAVVIVLGILITIVNVVLLPIFMPGAATSAI